MRLAGARRTLAALVLAQFFGALADSALLIAAIGLLNERAAPAWMTPALRVCFYVSYVLLGAFAGAVADAFAKSRVIVLTNVLKLAGCALLLAGLHPLLAFALIGFGASAHAPARYGILPELLAQEQLVAANAWMEIATVGAMLGGVALGSVLVDPAFQMAFIGTPARSATAGTLLLFACAVAASLAVPPVRATAPHALRDPARLVGRFVASCRTLWSDPGAGRSLAATSLFWAVAAVLQFLVLRWGTDVLGLPLARAALLQGALALGVIGGAVGAARLVPLHKALSVMPLGLGVGALIVLMPWVTTAPTAALVLAGIGLLAGLLLVPMNALLQERGNSLMHAGQSVAVQNFFENGAAFAVLLCYGLLSSTGVSLFASIAAVGVLVMAATMAGMRRTGALVNG
ncbi:lysophospholipid transporter LplT [Massilia sp. TWP1-3-3]|uniref:lysophospholipid transporter LplT n=1 Tax=Massilia sp. TWP1-3-3 TaxID=2804573 RepID=UPI003CE94FAB